MPRIGRGPAAARARSASASGNCRCRLVFPEQDVEAGFLQQRSCLLRGAQEARRRRVGPHHRVGRLASRSLRDILDCQPPAGLQHPVHLRVVALSVGDVHRHVLRPRQIETPVSEWQIERRALFEVHPIGQPGATGELDRRGDEFGSQVDPGDPAAPHFGQISRRASQPRADVEHTLTRLRRQHACKFLSRDTAARVQLIHRGQVIDGQAIDVLARFCESREDAFDQSVTAVVACNLARHALVLLVNHGATLSGIIA